MNHDAFIIPPQGKISLLKDYDPAYKDDYHEKAEAEKKLQTDVQRLAKYQNILYAQNTYALLIIFQARNAHFRLPHAPCPMPNAPSSIVWLFVDDIKLAIHLS